MVVLSVGLSERSVGGFDAQSAAMGHGVPRVGAEVQDDLVHLGVVQHDIAQVCATVESRLHHLTQHFR